MFKQFIKRSFFLFFLLLGLGGCLSELDILPDKSDLEKLSCLVDGEPFEATSGKGLLAVDFIRTDMQQTDDYFLLTVFGVTVQNGGEALAVGFKLGGSDPEDIEPGNTYTAWVAFEDVEGAFEGAMGGVEKRKSVTSNEALFKAGSSPSGEISLTVTAIDLDERKISGTFQFTAHGEEDSDIRIEVTEGIFENIKWEETEPKS